MGVTLTLWRSGSLIFPSTIIRASCKWVEQFHTNTTIGPWQIINTQNCPIMLCSQLLWFWFYRIGLLCSLTLLQSNHCLSVCAASAVVIVVAVLSTNHIIELPYIKLILLHYLLLHVGLLFCAWAEEMVWEPNESVVKVMKWCHRNGSTSHCAILAL